jgi:hypothetical protein
MAMTDAAGRWAFHLLPASPDITLVVAAPALKVASIFVQRSSFSRIALTASGRALSGTVAPAQPGRNVEIQRFVAAAQGKLQWQERLREPANPAELLRRGLDDGGQGTARRSRLGLRGHGRRPGRLPRPVVRRDGCHG